MKRYFSVVETVRIEYEIQTTEEQDKEIEKMGYQKWLESLSFSELESLSFSDLFNNSNFNQILDYIETERDSIQAEKE